MRIATWNLNTWINHKNGVTNEKLWQWAEDNLAADIVIFTEAATPPPNSIATNGWSAIHRPGGIPNRSGWGTVIAGRNLRVEHITHVGKNKKYELDRLYPGSFTAADVWEGDEYFATIIGLYLPYRKDASKNFIGHPEGDLENLSMDFVQMYLARSSNLIIAGDLNTEYDEIPNALEGPMNGDLRLVDPFENEDLITYKQDWNDDGVFKMDYIYLSKDLAKRVKSKLGGIRDFPTAFGVSDHAPLLLELK